MKTGELEVHLNALATAWMGKIRKGGERKKRFNDVAAQCQKFYTGAAGFWDNDYWLKYHKGGAPTGSQFKIVVAKAFELVAIYAPSLLARYPVRNVRPYKPVDVPQEFVVRQVTGMSPSQFQQMGQMAQQVTQAMQQGQPVPPQMQMQAFQFEQMQKKIQGMFEAEQTRRSDNKTRSELEEQYLNYTPREQPGTLLQHAEDGLTEALVKGRGVLTVEAYTPHGSDRKLTGCFHKSVDYFVTDPDAVHQDEILWMAVKHVQPWWEVERKFRLPAKSLQDKAHRESAQHMAESEAVDGIGGDRIDAINRGENSDLLTYWEVFSKAGVGTKFQGAGQDMDRAFSDVVGDHAYIAIAPGVDWPLNAHPDRLRGATDEDVRRMFDWPIPFWADNGRWPVALLDFYRDTDGTWPLSPLSPGLGELTAMNIIMSALVSQVWDRTRDIIAVNDSAFDEIKAALLNTTNRISVLKLNEVHNGINNSVATLQRPDMKVELFNILDILARTFDKRVGLSEILYSQDAGGRKDRSATDSKGKQEAASVRPQYMADKVESWLTEAARMERMCMLFSRVSGRDVAPLMGNMAAGAWDTLITNADPEVVLRETNCTIEASSARKPNKAREVSNMQGLLPAISQELSKHADVTGDTAPLNKLYEKYGESIEQDMSGLRMGQRMPPPPPPEVQQQQQQEMQAEQQAWQAEEERKAVSSQQEMQQDAATSQQDLQQDAAEHGQEMVQSHQEHTQKMEQSEQEGELKLKLQQEQAAVARKVAAAKPKSGTATK